MKAAQPGNQQQRNRIEPTLRHSAAMMALVPPATPDHGNLTLPETQAHQQRWEKGGLALKFNKGGVSK